MAVASAGPYANDVHLAPTPHYSNFTGWMLFLTPGSVKPLKANTAKSCY